MRDSFIDMGWVEQPGKVQPRWRALMEESRLPPTGEDPREFWIFAVPADGGDWRIANLTVNGQKVGGSGGWGQKSASPLVCATRCRFLVIDNDQLVQWPYRDITAARVRDKDVTIQFRDGGMLQFRVNVKGPRTIDFARRAYWSFAGDNVDRYYARSVAG